jgi:ABC-type anion transport system duplicated permease subunit
MPYVVYESRSLERPAGVFISLDALVLTGIAIVAFAVMALLAIVPRIGIPVGVGVAVATLLFTVWTQYGRSR